MKNELTVVIQLFREKKYEQALIEALKLRDKNPNFIPLKSLLGVLHLTLKDLGAAQESFEEVLLHDPNNFDALSNLGVIYLEFGKIQPAIQRFVDALSIDPDHPQLLTNLGNAYLRQNEFDAAIHCYEKAIDILPDLFTARLNLALAHKNAGQNSLGLKALEDLLFLQPSNANALFSYGNILNDTGDYEGAVTKFAEAISHQPDFNPAYINLANLLPIVEFTKTNKLIQKSICSVLSNTNYLRPSEIVVPAINLIKLEPNLDNLLKIRSEDFGVYLNEIVNFFNNSPLLLELMQLCPLVDKELELFFISLRKHLLLEQKSIEEEQNLRQLQIALATQCFINEYVYHVSNEEDQKLIELKARIKLKLNRAEQPRLHEILSLASYKPLQELEGSSNIKSNKYLKNILTLHLENSQIELHYSKNIKILKNISNTVSVKVKEQYEYYPYPRWLRTSVPEKTVPLEKFLEDTQIKYEKSQLFYQKHPKILIAGSGTGQQPLSFANKIHNARVTALDLSLASLCYAERKTLELGCDNIEYIQGDILDSELLNTTFDIIICSGVLHHLQEPLIGWEKLNECLKPGGLMKVSLYSKSGRQDINKTRCELDAYPEFNDRNEIRNIRSEILHSSKQHHVNVTRFADFYSLSDFFDLLFNVNEHQFTISQIHNSLEILNLKFCGFQNDKVNQIFMKEFGIQNLLDLHSWGRFEQKYPYSFAGMYQFWCQKPK